MRFLAFAWLAWQILLSPAILSVPVEAVMASMVHLDHLQHGSSPEHHEETRSFLRTVLLVDRNDEDYHSNQEKLGIRWSERKLKPSPKPLNNISPSLVVANQQTSTARKPARVANTATTKTGTTKKPLNNKVQKRVPGQQAPKKGSTPKGSIDVVQTAPIAVPMPSKKASSVRQTVTFASLSMNDKYVACLQNFGSGKGGGNSMKNNSVKGTGKGTSSTKYAGSSTTIPETTGGGKGSGKGDNGSGKSGTSGSYKQAGRLVVADVTEVRTLSPQQS